METILNNLSNTTIDLLLERFEGTDVTKTLKVESYKRFLRELSFEDLMLESADLREVYLGDEEKGIEPAKEEWIREEAERDWWLCEEEIKRRGGLAMELKMAMFQKRIEIFDLPTLLEGLLEVIKEGDPSSAWKVVVYENVLQDLGV